MAGTVVSRVETISFGAGGVSLGPNNTQPPQAATDSRAVPDFFFGQENALLRASVAPLIHSGTCPFRPLVLVGPSGVGKSHLAAGIAAATVGVSVTHLSAADFARQATEATSPVDAAARHRALHGIETLILEDVHQLAKKPAAQTALATLLDALLARDATVIITLNRPPAKLEHFSPTLVDRLSAGLVLSLSPPSPVVRRAMIAHIADREQVKISSGAADRLAEAPLASWNEIRGALLELRFAGGQSRATIRLTDIRRYLAEKPAPGAPDVRDITLTVAKHFGLWLSDLQSPSRRRGVVDARNIAAYIARKNTAQSLQQLGQYLGGRDHTTILHGIRKVEQQLEEDPAQRQVIADLLDKLFQQQQLGMWKSCQTPVSRSSMDGDE